MLLVCRTIGISKLRVSEVWNTAILVTEIVQRPRCFGNSHQHRTANCVVPAAWSAPPTTPPTPATSRLTAHFGAAGRRGSASPNLKVQRMAELELVEEQGRLGIKRFAWWTVRSFSIKRVMTRVAFPNAGTVADHNSNQQSRWIVYSP